MDIKIQDLMVSSGVGFGTSGARGLADNMTGFVERSGMRKFISVVLLWSCVVGAASAGELAGVRFEQSSHGYQVQVYEGTPYLWLGMQVVGLTADIEPSAQHKLMLLWGSKNDQRQAVVSINGLRQRIAGGGYDGFQWLAVPIGDKVEGERYEIVLRPVPADVPQGFVSQVRLVTSDVNAESLSKQLPNGVKKIEFFTPPARKLTDEERALWDPSPKKPDWKRAERSARIAGIALSKVQRWLHETCLPVRDARTGLFRGRGGQWNYRDTAADCYPFYVWAAFFTDKEVLDGVMIDTLKAEQRLCNHLDRLPVNYDMDKQTKIDMSFDAMIFGASEYAKDGLVPIVELTGPNYPWFDRMRGLVDDIFKHARCETKYGNIPSTNVEVNGELLQILPRLYCMTGEDKYLDWAHRMADHYLLGGGFIPSRLSDHGCEIIGGLGLLYAIDRKAQPAKCEQYKPHMKYMFDEILRRGTNSDGIIIQKLHDTPGPHDSASTGDGWGYDFVGFKDFDLAEGTTLYSKPIHLALSNLLKPRYENYNWGHSSRDNIADSVEGGLYLLYYQPVAEGFVWADRVIERTLVDHADADRLWGTHKLEANTVRTVLIHTMLHTQNTIARPWRQGLQLGAAPCADGICIYMACDKPYEGRLEFDIPRHRLYMGFGRDWPRMNTVPEWFTVEPDETPYDVTTETTKSHTSRSYTGRQLHEGLPIKLQPGQPLGMVVKARPGNR